MLPFATTAGVLPDGSLFSHLSPLPESSLDQDTPFLSGVQQECRPQGGGSVVGLFWGFDFFYVVKITFFVVKNDSCFLNFWTLWAAGFTLWWNPGWERLWGCLPVPAEVAEKLNWASEEIQSLRGLSSWSPRPPKFGCRRLINPLNSEWEPRKAVLPEEGCLSSWPCVGCGEAGTGTPPVLCQEQV